MAISNRISRALAMCGGRLSWQCHSLAVSAPPSGRRELVTPPTAIAIAASNHRRSLVVSHAALTFARQVSRQVVTDRQTTNNLTLTRSLLDHRE